LFQAKQIPFHWRVKQKLLLAATAHMTRKHIEMRSGAIWLVDTSAKVLRPYGFEPLERFVARGFGNGTMYGVADPSGRGRLKLVTGLDMDEGVGSAWNLPDTPAIFFKRTRIRKLSTAHWNTSLLHTAAVYYVRSCKLQEVDALPPVAAQAVREVDKYLFGKLP
jgi:hypothetical protein